MAKIRQYIPGFISGVEPETREFNTLEELLDIPWVSRFKTKEPKPGYFHQYSVSRDDSQPLLVAEVEGGTKQWVVGYLDDKHGVCDALPEWNASKKPQTKEEPILLVADVRNKLSPTVALINMLEDADMTLQDSDSRKMFLDTIKQVKASTNYLAQREVFVEK